MLADLGLGPTVVADLANAVFTALFVAGGAAIVVWYFQSRRQDAVRQHDREVLLAQAISEARLQFVARTSELSGDFYFATQRYGRQKRYSELWGTPDRDEFDSLYTKWASRCQVLEQELRARYGSDSKSFELWHAARHLLTVRYFDFRDWAKGLLAGGKCQR